MVVIKQGAEPSCPYHSKNNSIKLRILSLIQVVYTKYFTLPRTKLKKMYTINTLVLAIFLIGVVICLFTCKHGLLRNLNLAWYRTIACIFLLLAKIITLPKDFITEVKYPEFYSIWLSDRCKNLPQWVKNLIERGCVKHPGTTPEDELLRMAKNLSRLSAVFLLAALGFVVYQVYTISENALSLGALDYYKNALEVLGNSSN